MNAALLERRQWETRGRPGAGHPQRSLPAWHFGAVDECPGSIDQIGNIALCEALDNYMNREIAFTAASGNDLMEVELPANHPDVAAIGATATDGTHWERLSFPNAGELGSESGSNYSQDPEVPTLDLVAPGQLVLSTVFTGLGPKL